MYFNLTDATMPSQQEMNIIALVTTFAIILSSFALSSCRARLAQKKVANTVEVLADLSLLLKRLQAAEETNAICVANLNALMLNLAAFHKARIVRNDTKRRYSDNRRDTELISALHKAEVNYKKAKDFLSSYVIEATEAKA
jgi:hypothetical protein